MGLFSWMCKGGCGYSIRNPGAPSGVDGWMGRVVCLTRDGTLHRGVYDGYGRILDTRGNQIVVWRGEEQEPEMWHQDCWEAAGRPQYTGPSSGARDQGHFVDEREALVPPPSAPTVGLRLRRLAQEALRVQDACNLSGVVLGFSRAMTELRVIEPDKGTAFYNTHPICVIWADKVSQLTGTQSVGHTAVLRAFEEVHKLAEE